MAKKKEETTTPPPPDPSPSPVTEALEERLEERLEEPRFDLEALLESGAPLLEIRRELIGRGYVEAGGAADARGTYVRLILHGGRPLELTRRDGDKRLEGVLHLDSEEMRGAPHPGKDASPEALAAWQQEQDYIRGRLEELTRPRVGRELLEFLG